MPLGSDAGLIVTGTSSLVMVPRPWLSAMVALVAPLRLTKKVSFASGTVSAITGTVIVRVVWPGVKLSAPLVLV